MFTPTIFGMVAAAALMSYLLGSINFAIIVSHILAKEDVRKHGSGNAGMTNMLRTYGKGPAALTACGDFLKAVLAVLLSRIIFNQFMPYGIDIGYIAGLFVILGHVYPLYFGFRGGKGVLTTLGVIMVVNPLVFLIVCTIFIPVVFITKIVSIASVFGAISYPVITYTAARLRGYPTLFETVSAAVYMAIILIMHRENIKRLLNGTENKFGKKKS